MDERAPAGAAVLGSLLLEREEPRERLAELAAAARYGRGSLVTLAGGPGEGKTALVDEAAELGALEGLRILRAYGSSLEQPFAFGVVRQLLDPAVIATEPSERAGLFSGAARLAASVLGIDEPAEPLDPFAAQHALYWLVAELAGRAPTMLIVDDAHWADDASRAWLASLSRRIGDLPLLVLVATRPPAFDGTGDALGALLADVSSTVLRVGPLGRESVATLTRRALGTDPDSGFSDACLHATGGNPLAVVELLRDLRRAGASPDALRAGGLGDRAPETIGRHVRGRLDSLGAHAIAVSQALAVLGDRSPLRRVASLAEVELDAAGRLVDELTAAGIIARADELRFEHPLVQAAVRDSISPRRRAALHARAAALIGAEDGDPEAVAAHLLMGEPGASSEAVTALRAAAAAAIARGAPPSARSYLRRALAEPPSPEVRSAVLIELASAAWVEFDAPAMDYLESTRELVVDRTQRARLDLMLAEMCFYGGDRDRLFGMLERGLADLGAEAPALSLALRAMRTTALASLDTGWLAADDSEHEELAAQAAEVAPYLRLSVVLAGLWRGRLTAPETIDIVAPVLEQVTFPLADPGAPSQIAQGLIALIYSDDLERAAGLSEIMMSAASAQGNELGLGLASWVHGVAQLRRGALANAEASLLISSDLATEHNGRFAQAITRPVLAEVLIERGRLDEAEQVLVGIPAGVSALTSSLCLRLARGHLHRARGEAPEAIAELEQLGAECVEHEMRNPGFMPWRSELATLIAAEDPGRAGKLVAGELEDADRMGLPRGIGLALRARATIESGAQREGTLREAVAAFERSPARLELARALIDLGGHLRRTGQRREAREPLRRALELAHRSAAEPLISVAGEELRAADGRPRNPWLTGAASLTPQELRVARLAAAGRSNHEIAEVLFITLKTVEMHLTHAYRKLDSTSRSELSRMLENELSVP